jgi:hypothetical protein
MRGADSWLQTICPRLRAAGSFLKNEAIGCRTGQEQRRAGREMPHPMVRGFAARVKPDRATFAREGPGKEPVARGRAIGTIRFSAFLLSRFLFTKASPGNAVMFAADGFSPDLRLNRRSGSRHDCFHSERTPCFFPLNGAAD